MVAPFPSTAHPLRTRRRDPSRFPEPGCNTDVLERPDALSGVFLGALTCGTSIALTDPPNSWTFNGDATFQASNDTTVVSGGLSAKAGSAIYYNPIATDSFTITFEAQL